MNLDAIAWIAQGAVTGLLIAGYCTLRRRYELDHERLVRIIRHLELDPFQWLGKDD